MNIISLLKSFFILIKKPEFVFFKTIIVIIINLWLLIIFWKISIIEGSHVINNNNNKLFSIIEKDIISPILVFFNVELSTVNPNIMYLLILTVIILIVNLLALEFSNMIILGFLIFLTRYLYKLYIIFINKASVINNIEDINNVNTVVNANKEHTTALIEPVIASTDVSSHFNWYFISIVAVGAVILVSLLFYIISSNHIDISNIKFKVFKTQLNNDVSQFKNKVDTDHLLIKNDMLNVKNDVSQFKDQVDTDHLLIKNDILNVRRELLGVKHKTESVTNKIEQNEFANKVITEDIANIKNDIITLKQASSNIKPLLDKAETNTSLFKLDMKNQIDKCFNSYDNVNKSFVIKKISDEMSDVNKKIANLSEKLVEISNTSLSEAVVTKIVNSSSNDFFTFKDATLKFINSFTADVIGAVERVEKLTPPTTPRNHFTNNLKSKK